MNVRLGVSHITELEGQVFVSLQPYQLAETGELVDPVDPNIALLISPQEARNHQVLPFSKYGEYLFVAAARPHNLSDLSFIEYIDQRCIVCRAEPEDIQIAQDRVYGLTLDEEHERLGSYLLRTGAITSQQLIAAVEQQKTDKAGQKLGAILLQQGSATHWDIAEAVAVQRGYPLIDLLNDSQRDAENDETLESVWNLVERRFWYRHLVVPLASDENTLTIAIVDVEDKEALSQLEKQSGRRLRVFVTGYRDIMSVLNDRYGDEDEEESRTSLLKLSPEDSAATRTTKGQIITLAAIGVALVAGFLFKSVLTGTIVAGFIELLYAAASIFRLWAMVGAVKTDSELVVTEADMQTVPPTSLPEYTVLVPLYKEAEVLPTLASALQALRYPKDRLDVKLLLEEDDKETIDAAIRAKLPSYMEIVVVPSSEPKTKPKACNYGLAKARGEYVVIFDAEDIPEPDQLLKAVTVFRQSHDDQLACIQAKLSYFNDKQNILTRWFTAEYANWFELLLPSLFRLDMPIPLGGTSNHFRTDVLRSLGAWDPYNVTEDADLGVRLHKAGYRTGVMNSTTFEEANSDFVNWIRQRSRWVKGYMQTWLVHMRHPIRLWKEIGTVGFWGFQFTVGGTALQFLINPILWAMTAAWFIFGSAYMQQIFSGWVYYLGNLCLFLGNIAFVYASMVGVAKARRWDLVTWALLSPIYWLLMSVASYKSLYQLITKPSYWEKTVHGLTERPNFVQSSGTFGLDL